MNESNRNDSGAWERLFNRRRFGVKLGLENERAILAGLGNPQNSYPIIHVAGTNGKGSTCALSTSILSAAGLRVGLFTSPHLSRFNERYRIGDDDITDEKLTELVSRVEGAVDAVQADSGVPVTFFECSTAMAFEYFRQEGVDVAVIEVGLGGRFDATNVVNPVVSVLTRISLEHMEYLGDTVGAIAMEKAGIVKPGVRVVCGANSDEARDTIRRVAREQAAPFLYVPDVVGVAQKSVTLDGQKVTVESRSASYGTVLLPLLGAHQLENLATAVAAVESFADRLGVGLEPAVMKKGIASVRWPGRLTRVADDPPILIDGAHNPGGAGALAAALKQLAGKRPVGLVVGMCRDKDAKEFARELTGRIAAAWAVPVRNERTFAAAELRDALAPGGLVTCACDTLQRGIEAATEWARSNGGLVCIAGSLFLAGEALELMGERNR